MSVYTTAGGTPASKADCLTRAKAVIIDVNAAQYTSGSCEAFFGSDCTTKDASGDNYDTIYVAAGTCLQTAAAATLDECERMCMLSKVGCKSFNYLPPARDPTTVVANNCEWTPNSASDPDHLAVDGHRGFAYNEKFKEANGDSKHAYCGGPYRGDGRVFLEKSLADCKTHCSNLGDSCREFRWFNSAAAESGDP